MSALSENLLTRLLRADVVCKECGDRYGKYSVGCSSTWMGTCGVCGEHRPITEVRDWGYLSKGIKEEKEKIAEQSHAVAKQMNKDPIFEDILWDGVGLADDLSELASYEEGEIACKFTEAEIDFLSTVIDQTSQDYPPGKDVVFDSLHEKITDLYEDYCVKYELSPAMKAYLEKYGDFPGESDNEKWEGFRDAFNLLNNK